MQLRFHDTLSMNVTILWLHMIGIYIVTFTDFGEDFAMFWEEQTAVWRNKKPKVSELSLYLFYYQKNAILPMEERENFPLNKQKFIWLK